MAKRGKVNKPGDSSDSSLIKSENSCKKTTSDNLTSMFNNSETNGSDKYDRYLYGEYSMGVIFVEKNGLYGIINKEGDEIIPCKYVEYSDAWDEWSDMGFPSEKSRIITPEQKAIEEQKLYLEGIRQDLINQGHINRLSLYDNRAVLGAASVRLPNGGIGVAVSVVGKSVEIFDENGNHLMSINEGGSTVLSSDGENLYFGTYGTERASISAYKMGSFERKWKRPMNDSSIQSIAVTGDEIAIFDMSDGTIKYFDKKSGEPVIGKDIDTRTRTGRSHQNLAAMCIFNVPKLEMGVNKGISDFCNELQTFDNKLANELAGRSVSSIITSSNPIAVDEKNGRVYMAVGNMIGIFDVNGYAGVIPESTRNITELDFDSQTGCLLVSLIEGKGKVEALDSYAIDEFIKKSKYKKDS